MDELIAWGQITIPTNVLQGETHEDWYPLNGKQGDGVEGMINLVLSYTVCFLGLKFSIFHESCRFPQLLLNFMLVSVFMLGRFPLRTPLIILQNKSGIISRLL